MKLAGLPELAESYTSSLHAYLEGADGAALGQAYEVGRRAMEMGLGVLDITAAHEQALMAALLSSATPEESARRAKAAVAVFAESLAAFDMAQRGYRAATARSLQLNDELEASAKRLADINQELQSEITERTQAEDGARRAQEEAERANRAKSEFLSKMSHELRTPLNAILGFGQLLEMEPLDPEQHDALRHILKGGRHLLDLINEVLDIARIEAGRITLSAEPVRVSETLQETLSLVRPLAAERGVSLESEERGAAERHIMADRQRLKQVLLNLLSNAVKYNVEGGWVRVRCSDSQDGFLRIEVRDSGPGIPAGKLERLFVPFDRLGAEQTAVEGTGLGLALSRSLTEAMGGTIEVETASGQGSCFAVTFLVVEGPVDQYGFAPDATPPELEALSRPHTILYVEDNPSNLNLIQRVLAAYPAIRLLSTMQGSLGLDLAREHRPDLILLDVHLPDMSGGELLVALQNQPRTADIPVVVVSADATAGHTQALVDAGARTYLTKPLDLRKFLRVVNDALAERQHDHVREG